METEPTSEALCFFKKLDDGQSPEKEDCISNFGHALFFYKRYTFQFSDAGLGLAPHVLVQSDPVWSNLVSALHKRSKMTSHIYTQNLRDKLCLALIWYIHSKSESHTLVSDDKHYQNYP
jgi:hypothetical protein